jgi:hypothetical protein
MAGCPGCMVKPATEESSVIKLWLVGPSPMRQVVARFAIGDVLRMMVCAGVGLTALPACAETWTCTYVSPADRTPELVKYKIEDDGHLVAGLVTYAILLDDETELVAATALSFPDSPFVMVVAINKRTFVFRQSSFAIDKRSDIVEFGKCVNG